MRDEGRGTRVLEPDAVRRAADGGVLSLSNGDKSYATLLSSASLPVFFCRPPLFPSLSLSATAHIIYCMEKSSTIAERFSPQKSNLFFRGPEESNLDFSPILIHMLKIKPTAVLNYNVRNSGGIFA